MRSCDSPRCCKSDIPLPWTGVNPLTWSNTLGNREVKGMVELESEDLPYVYVPFFGGKSKEYCSTCTIVYCAYKKNTSESGVLFCIF